MAQIKQIEGLSNSEISEEINNGGRFVVFMYCFSLVVMTFKRGSDIYFVRANESAAKYSIKYTLLTLLLGWWGIPWGPIHSISSLFTNFKGGKDVTEDVMEQLYF